VVTTVGAMIGERVIQKQESMALERKIRDVITRTFGVVPVFVTVRHIV
jgi:hypothetical protein